jgi:hypothetical protein
LGLVIPGALLILLTALLDRQVMTGHPRPFPPPRTVEGKDGYFIIRDNNGQALAYVYFEDEPTASGGQTPHPRRGAADRSEHCQAARAIAR